MVTPAEIARLMTMQRKLNKHAAEIVAIILDFGNKYTPDQHRPFWHQKAELIEDELKKVDAGMSAWINLNYMGTGK